MNERDLREALAPLAGDPVKDAARVLAALPPAPPGAPKLPPLAWWLLGSGVVLGAIVGLWFGRGTAAKPEEKPAVPTKAEEPVTPPPPPARDDYLYLIAKGKVRIDEPRHGARDLEEGSFIALAGSVVTTGDQSNAGGQVMGSDARFHFDEQTVATLATNELRLEKGRVSLTAGGKGDEFRAISDLATVRFQRGTVVVHRMPDALAVQAVNGIAHVRTSTGQTQQVDQGLQVLVHDGRGMGEVRKIPPGDWSLTWWQQRPRESEGLYLMAFGNIHIDEPGVGPQDLAPMAYAAAVGTTVTTDTESQAGLLVHASDMRVRLDHETVATVDTAAVRLSSGRVFVCSGAREGDFRIESDLATVAWRSGCAIAIRMPEGLAVIATSGEVIVRTKAGQQTARLNRGTQVFADPDRGLSAVEKVPFLGTATSWMTNMIVQSQDEAELKERVSEMVDAFTEGSQREAATSEIRKLGARTTGALVESIGKRPVDRDYARAAAAVAADVADYRNTGWLFKLLEHEDADVRVLAWRGLTRVTGTDGGTDETLWRNGSVEQRTAAITAWGKSLK